MLQSGSTSVLGRAYGVDDVLPLPVPEGSGGVVDRLRIPAARRCGGGDGGEFSAGLRLNPGQSMEEGERGANLWIQGCGRPPLLSPPFIGGGAARGSPQSPSKPRGAVAKGEGANLPPKFDP